MIKENKHKRSELLHCNRCEMACQILVQIHTKRKLSNKIVVFFFSYDYYYLRQAVVPPEPRQEFVCILHILLSLYTITWGRIPYDILNINVAHLRAHNKNLILSRFICEVNVCMRHTIIFFSLFRCA